MENTDIADEILSILANYGVELEDCAEALGIAVGDYLRERQVVLDGGDPSLDDGIVEESDLKDFHAAFTSRLKKRVELESIQL